MKLSVANRLALLSILPREGNITTIRIVSELKDELSFSEEEHAALKLRQDGDGIGWDHTVKDPMKDIPIGEKATDTIVESLKRASDRNQLMEAHLGVWDMFIPD
jgi:hypothetical protein